MGQKPKETHDLEHNDIMFPMKTAMTGGYWRYTYAKWNSARPIPWELESCFRHLVPIRTASAVAEMNFCWLTCAKRREFSGMIHWLTINNHPSNPQQPIQQPYVKRTSKLTICTRVRAENLELDDHPTVDERYHCSLLLRRMTTAKGGSALTTLWLCQQFAIENGDLLRGFTHEKGWFSILM